MYVYLCIHTQICFNICITITSKQSGLNKIIKNKTIPFIYTNFINFINTSCSDVGDGPGGNLKQLMGHVSIQSNKTTNETDNEK